MANESRGTTLVPRSPHPHDAIPIWKANGRNCPGRSEAVTAPCRPSLCSPLAFQRFGKPQDTTSARMLEGEFADAWALGLPLHKAPFSIARNPLLLPVVACSRYSIAIPR